MHKPKEVAVSTGNEWSIPQVGGWVEIRRQSLGIGFQRCVSVWVWKVRLSGCSCVCAVYCVLCPGSGQRAKQHLGFLVACELKNNLHGAISFKSGESLTEPRGWSSWSRKTSQPSFQPWSDLEHKTHLCSAAPSRRAVYEVVWRVWKLQTPLFIKQGLFSPDKRRFTAAFQVSGVLLCWIDSRLLSSALGRQDCERLSKVTEYDRLA